VENAQPKKIKTVELPKDLVTENLRRFLRPGQDPLMKRMVEMLTLELSRSEETRVNSFGIYMALTVGCLAMGRDAAAARGFLPLIVRSLSGISHPDALKFADAVSEGLPGVSQEPSSQKQHSFARKTNVNSRK
jgi:hypothetical protein